jgi:hypothetical protein
MKAPAGIVPFAAVIAPFAAAAVAAQLGVQCLASRTHAAAGLNKHPAVIAPFAAAAAAQLGVQALASGTHAAAAQQQRAVWQGRTPAWT